MEIEMMVGVLTPVTIFIVFLLYYLKNKKEY